MGLYTSFDTTMYHDKKDKNKSVDVDNHKNNKIESNKDNKDNKKSLYSKSKEQEKKKNITNFKKKYSVGQRVAIQGANGVVRTKSGIIAEIVAENLMYVYMEDTYKDATDQWLVDFVTDEDNIVVL
jgi:hypothetical protein